MTELSERRLAFNTLINRDASSIVLARNTAVSDSAGGATATTANVTAQTFRLAALPRPQGALTDTGEVVTTSAMLIGTYNADIKPGDTFTLDGRNYEVVYVRAYDWKTEADLVLR